MIQAFPNTLKMGSIAEFVGQNGAFQRQAGESVGCGYRRRRELEARSLSPPLACLPLKCWFASGESGCWMPKSIFALQHIDEYCFVNLKILVAPTNSAEEKMGLLNLMGLFGRLAPYKTSPGQIGLTFWPPRSEPIGH